MIVAVSNVPDVVIWLPAVTTLLGLIAVSAAWRTAAITARSFRRSILPDLHAMFIWERGGPLPANVLELAARNLGGGAAKTPAVMILVKDQAVLTNVGSGFLRPGHGFRLTTTIPANGLTPADYKAVVSCRDVNGLYHAWSHAGDHQDFRDRWRRPIKEIDLRDVLRAFFPDAELEGKKPIPYSVTFLDP